MDKLKRILLALTVTCSTAHAGKEAVIYNVDNHSDHCGGGDFNYGDATGDYLETKIESWSWDHIVRSSDVNVWFHQMTDGDYDTNGQDDHGWYGWDTSDVAFIYSHGSKSCSNGYSSVQMGRDWQPCTVRYGRNYAGNDAWWGGDHGSSADLNIAIIETCNSVQDCVWSSGGYRNNSGGFGALLGYHGISYDSSTHLNNFKDFVDSSRYDGLGDNFVAELTRFISGSENDECAAVVTIGATSSDRDNIFDNGGLQDWKTVTSHSSSSMYYMDNCDPDDGAVL